MRFYQLAFRYLRRKKTKALLLLFVLVLVNTMILSTCMILRATNDSKQSMQSKTNSKIVAEVLDINASISDSEVEQINSVQDVSSVNRIGKYDTIPTYFAPITGSSSSNEDNMKVAFLSYDDLEKDSPFSEMQYRLTSGEYIKENSKGVVIHESLATQNGLNIGDELKFDTEDGNTITIPIVGLFKSAGNIEDKQPANTTAVNRIENQIFIDNGTSKELLNDSGFYKLVIYTKDPENMKNLQSQVQNILGKSVELSTSDTLYQQMSAPLDQISRVTKLMLLLTLSAGTIVVSLLLCMWMRTRQKEIAIFMSLGKKKNEIILQSLCESGIVFLVSVAIAALIGNGIQTFLQNIMVSSELSSTDLNILLSINDIGALIGLGGIIVFIALCISLIPTLKANPKDILARMEG